MSLQLVPSLRKNAQSIFSRAISLDSTKYCKRDVIAVDVTKDIEDVTTHTGQVLTMFIFILKFLLSFAISLENQLVLKNTNMLRDLLAVDTNILRDLLAVLAVPLWCEYNYFVFRNSLLMIVEEYVFTTPKNMSIRTLL